MSRNLSAFLLFLLAFSPVLSHDSPERDVDLEHGGHHHHHDHHHHDHDHEEHDHHHHQHEEAPHVKYSEAKNVEIIEEDDHHDHDSSHHHHDHHHDEEAPHLKYTEAKNVEITEEDEHHHHGHHHHDHHHDHDEEAPHLKYTEAKNVKGSREDESLHHHHHHHHPHDTHEHVHIQTGEDKPSTAPSATRSQAAVWIQALCSTVLISAAPFLILFFIPLEANTADQQPLLKVLLAFASGGLLGDAFLHLIPHALSPHDAGGHSHEHSHSHSHEHSHGGSEGEHDHSADMMVGLWVLAGIVAFLCVEKFVRHVKGGHGHSHGPPMIETHVKNGDVPAKEGEPEGDETDVQLRNRKKTDEVVQEKSDDETSGHSHNEHEGEIKVAGYLNLAADFTHNFTDGLAIGASYLVSHNLGIITTITILLHEVPHEIGDFAILVQSGCSKRKAMFLQLSTATGALAGTVCGLLAQQIGAAATMWILPFTAGGFIYIATVSVMPELLQDAKVGQTFKEILGLLVGVAMMVLIAKFE